ncbi:MAG: GTP-binding protein [Candidatus Lloydbacteria bacterium]|nr:GTP-binding protein [Candidatus Lloydbacteria bacterium]
MKPVAAQPNNVPRPPVIVVMGHIDHGKSTLLDYIRKTNIVAEEAGGITQHISAYEAAHNGRAITFLDTPGHEAFSSMRECGVCAADIAVLVVSAEDGVKAQTLEAEKTIRTSGIPYLVALSKIDKPNANIEKAKQSLAENNIFVEGYGGDIPIVALSSKTGEGIDELLETILLVADMNTLTGDSAKNAEGIVLESNIDPRKGISATLIIKNGALRTGMFAVAGESMSPVRIMENFLGKSLKEARFSSPVRVIGWDQSPKTGSLFYTFDSKKEAEAAVMAHQENLHAKAPAISRPLASSKGALSVTIPLIIKTDAAGAAPAIRKEVAKLTTEEVNFRILNEGIGDISENDIKNAIGSTDKTGTEHHAIIVGFHVSIDSRAQALALRAGVTTKTFTIIYELSQWLAEEAEKRRPRIEVEETTGAAKILRVFSQNKNRQVLGGRVTSGSLLQNSQVKIMRREHEIGRGKIVELQQAKAPAREVPEGNEFGVMVESKIEIAQNDVIENFKLVTK